jgi:hypothetical protein
MGFSSDDQEHKIVVEWKNVEGTSEDTESPPFSLGGFVDPDAPFSTAFRWHWDVREYIENCFVEIRGGTKAIPLDEREGKDATYDFNIAWCWNTEEFEKRDDHHLIRDGNLFVYYPKQVENRPKEDGVHDNAELDKLNEKLIRSVVPLLTKARQSVLSLDWSQPIDIAMSGDASIAYFACAYPPAKSPIDLNLATLLWQAISEHNHQIKPDPSFDSIRVETQQLREPIAGLTGYRVNVLREGEEAVLTIIYVHGQGIFYAAWLAAKADSEGITGEQYEAVRAALEQKISASKQAVAEKMKPPTTVFRSKQEDTRCSLDYETTERGHRFTFHVAENSFENVLALAQQFGFDPHQMLTFFQSL